MIKKDASKSEEIATPVEQQDPSKAQLQRRMEEARENLSQTVEEIKETVEEQYESVKKTVTGVLDLREQFQKDPVVWSVGALSAGFALGYTLGYAHKNMKSSGGKHSELAAFADSLVDELSAVGHSLVLPPLNEKLKELFGFDFSAVLEEIGSAKKTRAGKKPVEKVTTKRSATRTESAKKRKPINSSKNKR